MGTTELGARLVSALAALATCAAVFAWTRAVFDAATARRAVAVLITSLGFLALGRYGSLDMLLACWLTTGVLAAERAVAEPRRPWLLVAAAVAAGLGMLTKGLVAPVFVTGVPLVHAYVTGRPLPSRRAAALAVALFVLVAAPWYVAAEVTTPGFLREFFWHHHVKRAAAAGSGFHPEPWWYYAPALGLLLFPWSVLLPAVLATTARPPDPRLRYCLCWAALVIGVFSLSRGKIATYVLPAVPPLAILTAVALGRPLGAVARRLAAAGLGILVAALAVAAPLAMRATPPPWDAVVTAAAGYLLVAPAAATLVLLAWRLRGLDAAVRALGAAAATGAFAFYAGAAPAVSETAGARRIADVITAHAEAPIVSYGVTPASLLFYVGRPVVRVQRPRALRRALADHPFAWVVTSPRHADAVTGAVTVYPWVASGRRLLFATAPAPAVASVERDVRVD